MKFVAPKLCMLVLLICCTSFMIPNATTLLRAHFETENIWAPPNKALPGSPVGDAMTYDNELQPALKVVSSGLEAKQALEFSNIKIGSNVKHNHWIGFTAVPADIDKKALTFLWSGKTINNITGSDVHIDCGLEVSKGGNSPLVRLHIDRSGYLHAAQFGKGPSETPDTKVGYVGETDHAISVIINMASTPKPTYKVTIFTPAAGLVGSHKGTLDWSLGDMKAKANKASVSFSFQETPVDPQKKYLLDGLSITQY